MEKVYHSSFCPSLRPLGRAGRCWFPKPLSQSSEEIIRTWAEEGRGGPREEGKEEGEMNLQG